MKALVPATPLIEKGLDVGLLSMMEYGTLTKFLKGEQAQATRIVVE